MRQCSCFPEAVIDELLHRTQECGDGHVRSYIKHKTSPRSNYRVALKEIS